VKFTLYKEYELKMLLHIVLKLITLSIQDEN